MKGEEEIERRERGRGKRRVHRGKGKKRRRKAFCGELESEGKQVDILDK